ncbi:MAG: hypothetical protein LUE99_04970 [Bacteroides sp.]|nr:hypothetical protein [Bacteroides sp.]
MEHELLTARLEREKEHQILMERENFFTGAAHELRTPLTLILSPPARAASTVQSIRTALSEVAHDAQEWNVPVCISRPTAVCAEDRCRYGEIAFG